MNCTQTQSMLDDYLDGSLSAIQLDHTQAHLNQCAECSHIFSQALALSDVLKDMPVPAAKIGYEQRMLKFLDKKQSKKTQQQNWFVAGFGSAIAATLTLWLVFSPISILTTNNENIGTVNLLVQKKQTVDLVFNLANDLTEATLTLELPEKIEVAGYPGKQQLSWKTSFKKGANRLALPIISNEAQSGFLIARLTNKGTTKTFRIRINTKHPPTSLYFRDILTTNT